MNHTVVVEAVVATKSKKKLGLQNIENVGWVMELDKDENFPQEQIEMERMHSAVSSCDPSAAVAYAQHLHLVRLEEEEEEEEATQMADVEKP